MDPIQLIDLPPEILCGIIDYVGPYALILLFVSKYFRDFVRDAKKGKWSKTIQLFIYTSLCKVAGRENHTDVIMWGLKNGCCPLTYCSTSIIPAAIRGNRLDILNKIKPHVKWMYKYTYYAASVGHIDVLNWIQENNLLPVETSDIPYDLLDLVVYYDVLKNNKRYVGMMCAVATQHNHQHVIIWALDHGFVLNEIACFVAAWRGHLNTLKWILLRGCKITSLIFMAAAFGGHLSILEYLHSLAPTFTHDISICSNAALGGHLNVLKWLRLKDYEWDDFTCYRAAEAGHLGVLQWAVENGCPFKHHIWIFIEKGNHQKILDWCETKNLVSDEDKKLSFIYSHKYEMANDILLSKCKTNDDFWDSIFSIKLPKTFIL